MKVRNYFVSNSSSTSFTLAVPDVEKVISEYTFEINLLRYERFRIRNEEELRQHFEDYHTYGNIKWDQDEDNMKEFERYLHEIHQGKHIVVCTAESECGGDDQIVYNYGAGKPCSQDVIILEEDVM